MVHIPKNLNDWDEYPGMVRWFHPKVLVGIVQRVITSALFGQYADRRLMQASLDVADEKEVFRRCGGSAGVCGASNEPVWLDYVADLGDGFDSTYAIAYLLGQKQLVIGTEVLPRAGQLIMGGDEVYPEPTQDDYSKRLQRPFECAFPRTDVPGADRPRLFMIPGNHDWYDGLTLFLGKFCRGRDTSLGSWNATQSRSYFAIHLKDNWWVWGYDSQLGEDIDKPQADYFAGVARQMPEGAKVILCASIPSWLHADIDGPNASRRTTFYRGLDYIANILRNECKGSKIPLVLSGDLHHYSRFVSADTGTQFITAGGGGAFLHPTHGLPEQVRLRFAQRTQTINLAKDGDSPACYPSRAVSRDLAWGNLHFIAKNPEFSLTLGVLYWIGALVLLSWRGYGQSTNAASFAERVWQQLAGFLPTPAFLLVGAAFLTILLRYADIQNNSMRRVFGAVHAVAHLGVLSFAAAAVSVSIVSLLEWPFGEILYFLALGAGMIVSGLIGGIVWGLYLLIASFRLGEHANDAFSAMRLDSFRHFLRIKIAGDQLTVYPIAIDNSPSRQDWQNNQEFKPNDQNTPVFVPKQSLGEKFIETPFVIDANNIATLKKAS